MMHVGDNRDVQFDDPFLANAELVDDNPIEPSIEPQMMRRSTREHNFLSKYSAYVMLTEEGEPETNLEVCPIKRKLNG